MAKYRKKPVVIDAWQWGPDGFTPPVPGWITSALEGGILASGVGEINPFWPKCRIRTLEGDMFANPGDWILRGVKGELYPCRKDIFEATYDEVIKD